MSIAAPNLDDRRFQDLVDDAKRIVMDRCPTWTDHNVSDPGVTLIETFAFMTDQLLYRLNRVPDRLYIKFLELIGIRLFPPTAARTDVTFWLSTPATTTLVIPAATRTATLRGEDAGTDRLQHAARARDRARRSLQSLATRDHDADGMRPRIEQLSVGAGFPAFGEVPDTDDALYVGLDTAAPVVGGGAPVRLPHRRRRRRPDRSAAGVGGVDRGRLGRAASSSRTRPAASTAAATSSSTCRTTTSRACSRASAPVGCGRAITAPITGQPRYSSSPIIQALVASTVGGSAAVGARRAQRSRDARRVDGPAGAAVRRAERTARRHRHAAGRRGQLGRGLGGVGARRVVRRLRSRRPGRHRRPRPRARSSSPPVVRFEDGSIRAYGAIPPQRAVDPRPRATSVGGGRHGNVPARALAHAQDVDPVRARR